MSVAPRTKRNPAPRRGPTSSSDYNTFQNSVAADLGEIASEVNALEAEIDRVHLVRFHEAAALCCHADRSIAEKEVENLFAAAAGDSIVTVVDFRGFLGPDFELVYTGFDTGRRARVEPLYGQVLLPYNHSRNRIYGVNTDTGEVVVPGTVEITVTGYDYGGTATAGTKKYAVNGNNQDYWLRKVRFPVDSDVDYVEAELQINLPANAVTSANMISVHPFPLKQVDILELKYSSTTADPTTTVSGFTAVNCASFNRWHFAATEMTKVKIRLRQRHFVEDNGFKVFYLGLQELLMHLVEFDKTANSATTPTDGNGLIVRVDAPTGYTFDTISRFYSSPTYATAGSDNGVYYRIYAEEALTNIKWDSFNDPSPQDTAVDISADALSSIYVAVNLQWDSTNNVSPVISRFALKYTVA